MTAMFPHGICPVCADQGIEMRWVTHRGALRCEVGHAFDIAREGYANLLPSSGRKNAVHGDTAAMLRARRDFLHRDHYRFLSDALTRMCMEILHASVTGSEPHALLDAGCGEGYYLHQLQRQFVHRSHRSSATGTNQQSPLLYGIDLSRDAARMAAKRDSQLRIVVGNTMVRLPFASGSMAVLLNLFAPRNPQEFARVLVAEGTLLIVIPAVEHLQEIREHVQLLPIEVDKEARVIEQLRGCFELVDRHPVDALLQLQPEDVRLLIAMTPNAWFVPQDRLWSLHDIHELPTHARFILMRFRKVPR